MLKGLKFLFFLLLKIEILLAVLAYAINLSHATKVMNLKKLFVTHIFKFQFEFLVL